MKKQTIKLLSILALTMLLMSLSSWLAKISFVIRRVSWMYKEQY